VGYDGTIRASDSDRERVVEVLRQAYTEGRLDLEEFDERTTAAYAARTWDGLRELTSDLPVDVVLGADIERTRATAGALPGQLEAGPGPHRRGPVFVPFLPIALFWLVLAGAMHTTGLVVPVIILLLVSLRLAGMRNRRGPGPGPGPGGHGPGGHGPGGPGPGGPGPGPGNSAR
jgi:Domain of unknown function (DUF1707)